MGKLIAVDFDGTIVEDAYPQVGKPKLFAIETLHQLSREGHRLILWTYRSGKPLEDAVAFCKKHNIELEAVNNSFECEDFDKSTQSRKINADIFIDDRNVGGFPGWGEVYQIISEKKKLVIDEESGRTKQKKKKKKRGFFGI